MKLGIMQPYFFPYIGYWQLMNAVDKYVIYDDVNFINRGWVNRNRILFGGQPRYFNLPTFGASQNKLINEIAVNHDEKQVKRNLNILHDAYKKAPYYSVVSPLIELILNCKEQNVAGYLAYSFDVICSYLGIETERMMSSALDKDTTLRGEAKILNICENLNASEYYNAIGGQELYSYEEFLRRGIELHFLNPQLKPYRQFVDNFVPGLSIIDVMMFNSVEEISAMLEDYTLL